MKLSINSQTQFLNGALALLVEHYRYNKSDDIKEAIRIVVKEFKDTINDSDIYLKIDSDSFGFDFDKMEFIDDV